MKREMIEEILSSGFKASLIITGGGVGAISQLLQYGGGSKFLVDARVPYSIKSFTSLTGVVSDFVSVEACEQLTRRALFDATNYVVSEEPCLPPALGVACTAKLTYDGEREGREHEAFIGIGCYNEGHTGYTYSNVRFPYPMSRNEQENFLAESILACIYMFVCNNPKYGIPSHIKEVQVA